MTVGDTEGEAVPETDLPGEGEMEEVGELVKEAVFVRETLGQAELVVVAVKVGDRDPQEELEGDSVLV